MRSAETLGRRLFAASVAWIVATLAISGIALALFFRIHIESRFDGALRDHLEELVAASDVGVDGRLELGWRPFDPRFNRPRSGWYWEIRESDRVVARSDSLWRSALAARGLDDATPGAIEFAGPAGERLRAVAQAVTLPRSESRFVFAVAGPVTDIDQDVRRFTTQIVLTLALLALGIMAAVVLQVRFGLRPLRDLRTGLAAIRDGRADRLSGDYPEEVRPLTEELNALLAGNAAMLERARAHAADLAHALKNPLTVIGNEARDLPGTEGDVLRREAAAMAAAIDRHLSRARAAGGQARAGQRTDVGAVVSDLVFSLERLHRDRALQMEVAPLEGEAFRGDREDLEEMLGNLLDNACKWAGRRVLVHASSAGGRLCVVVEDDGTGIPADRFGDVLVRGARLDESKPGTGMGLAIVRDIAEAYGGTVALEQSTLGGLRAALNLPAAHRVGGGHITE